MERRPALSRRAPLVVAALLLVAGLAGCSNSDRVGNRTAATVGDAEISQAHVVELMEAQVRFAELSSKAAAKAAKASPDDADIQDQAEKTKAAADDLKERYIGTGGAAGTDSFGTAGAAEALSTAIQLELVREAAREADVKVKAPAVEEARKSIVDNLKGQGLTVGKELGVFLDLYAELQAYQNALGPTLATPAAEREAQLRALYDQLPDQTQYCVNLVVTADEASTRAAYERVQAGEDFLTVGNEVSVDKSTLSEGAEQCVAATELTAAFPTVPAPYADGTLLPPTQVQSGWLFARVVRTKVPTFEDLRSQLDQQNEDKGPSERFTKALQRAAKRLGVTVDPRFGTWNAKTVEVDPPKAERSGTTTSTTVPSTTAGP